MKRHRCPDCGGPLVYGEGCACCPVCGFTACYSPALSLAARGKRKRTRAAARRFVRG